MGSWQSFVFTIISILGRQPAKGAAAAAAGVFARSEVGIMRLLFRVTRVVSFKGPQRRSFKWRAQSKLNLLGRLERSVDVVVRVSPLEANSSPLFAANQLGAS